MIARHIVQPSIAHGTEQWICSAAHRHTTTLVSHARPG